MSDFEIQGGPDALQSARDPKLGVVTAALKCWARDLSTALFSPAPDIGISIPEWNPRQIVQRDAGIQAGYDVTISFEGHPDGDNANGEFFEIEGSTAEEAIENHPNLDVLKKVYGPTSKQNNRIVFPETVSDKTTGGKGRNPMFGVDSWYYPSLIWSRNWVSKILPSEIVSELGTITNTPPGNPPQLSGNRNWLCIRATATFRGNIWQMKQSWQLSKPHGFVPEMYQRD